MMIKVTDIYCSNQSNAHDSKINFT